MNLILQGSSLVGSIAAVASKSMAHRGLLCSALADSATRLHPIIEGSDISATCEALRGIGAGIERQSEFLYITPIGAVPDRPLIDCRESGTTLRFLLPLAASLGKNAHFIGTGRLPDRPIAELAAELSKNGVCFSAGRLPFEISGKLRSGTFELPGDISSQYISALLLTLPSLEGDSRIVLKSRLQSAPFADLTIAVLRRFGVEIYEHDGGYDIKGGQSYASPDLLELEGDWSNSAFFLAAGALSGEVSVSGLSLASAQGDRQIFDILQRFGANISYHNGSVRVSTSRLAGCEIDISDTPDLFPILAILATAARGKTLITGTSRLRYKESDRIDAAAAMLRALGADIRIFDNCVEIPEAQLRGGVVDCQNDHRIAMSAAVAATICSGKTVLCGCGCVAKSYPSFFDDFAALGGKLKYLID